MHPPCRKSTALLSLLFLSALGAGCGGGEDREGAADGASAATDTARAADVRPQDTTPWMAERPAPDSVAPTRPDERAEPAAGSGGDWTAAASSGGGAAGTATLVAVRAAKHDGYDRVVFEFEGGVPDYRVEYVDSPQHECGSGREVRLPGDAWLDVRFTSAQAHDDNGNPTVLNRQFDPPGDNPKQLRLICDFEGHVEWVLGLGSPNRYRAFTLSGPARLVVDVRS